MGMFDWYEPQGPIACGECGSESLVWQGHGGPCGLMVWRQGQRAPVDQRVDDEVRLRPADLAAHRLPDVFVISGWCASEHATSALGFTNEGDVWHRTEVIDDLATDEAYRRARSRINRENGRPTT